jgi:hypothetical protein
MSFVQGLLRIDRCDLLFHHVKPLLVFLDNQLFLSFKLLFIHFNWLGKLISVNMIPLLNFIRRVWFFWRCRDKQWVSELIHLFNIWVSELLPWLNKLKLGFVSDFSQVDFSLHSEVVELRTYVVVNSTLFEKCFEHWRVEDSEHRSG